MTESDIVVVGAGSSGCALVHRLSFDPSLKVVLLEAGVSGEQDASVLAPGRWVSLMGSAYDWKYATEPEPGVAARSIAVPRGKALGGSSVINAMVHIRGARTCFDGWRAGGNPGWGHEDLLPYFELDRQLSLTQGDDPHAAHVAFLRAAVEHGFAANSRHNFNAPDPQGVAGFFPRNIVDGRRQSAAAAFLEPAMRRPNVDVRVAAHATRLLLNAGRVVGVEFVREGKRDQVFARREVILCAGAIDSPKLLMLSGIGPADQLRAHDIPVVLDRPGVGLNLQDHLKLSVRWKSRTALAGSSVIAGMFTSSSLADGDLQLIVGRGLDAPEDVITITVAHLKPRSRGVVALRSANPFAPPVVRANYLTEGHDVAAFLEGLRLARALGGSRPFDACRGVELEPGVPIADLEAFVREKADSIYHAAGTCRMGPASDREAVVDAELRVHGVDGVRVADASIMPSIVNAPTHAACVMIGEKCAAMIANPSVREPRAKV